MRSRPPFHDDVRYEILDGAGFPARVVTRGDVDRDLQPQRKPRWTKATHPYNYDPFTIWGMPRADKRCNASIYTDRLEQWDRAKYVALSQKHYEAGAATYRRPFDAYNCQGPLIEGFLRDWYDDAALKLLRVIEYCCPNTGYPTWRMDFITSKELP